MLVAGCCRPASEFGSGAGEGPCNGKGDEACRFQGIHPDFKLNDRRNAAAGAAFDLTVVTLIMDGHVVAVSWCSAGADRVRA